MFSSAGFSESVENPVSCKTSPDPFLAAAFPLTAVGLHCESSCVVGPDESAVAVAAPVVTVTAAVVAAPGVVGPLLRKFNEETLFVNYNSNWLFKKQQFCS